VTLALFVLSLAASLALGAVVALARLARSRVVAWSAAAYIEFVRNIPFMILVFLVFFVLPFYGVRIPAFEVGVTALTIYGGAYFAEIIRAAILAVPRGQLEAARALGMSYGQAMRRIILPQTPSFLIPPATNQAIMLIKETAVLSTITVGELTMAAQIVQGYTYSPIEVFFAISLLYWIACTAIAHAAKRLEAALKPGARSGATAGTGSRMAEPSPRGAATP
jgi:polar amino acid transport system permease protein/putative glutamine transport system permease protein